VVYIVHYVISQSVPPLDCVKEGWGWEKAILS